jgi:hypothetical protein
MIVGWIKREEISCIEFVCRWPQTVIIKSAGQPHKRVSDISILRIDFNTVVFDILNIWVDISIPL